MLAGSNDLLCSTRGKVNVSKSESDSEARLNVECRGLLKRDSDILSAVIARYA